MEVTRPRKFTLLLLKIMTKYGSEQHNIESKSTLENYHITYLGKIKYRRSPIPSLFDIYIYKQSLMLHGERQEVSRCRTLLA